MVYTTKNSINNIEGLLQPVEDYLKNSPDTISVLRSLLEKDTSQKTKMALISDLKCIFIWYKESNVENFTIGRFTARDLIEYKKYCQEVRKYSARTINRKLINIRNFCKVAVKEGELNSNPADGIKFLPLQTLAPKSLIKQEFRKLLKEVEIRGNLRDMLIVEMLGMAGFRVSELANMSIHDLSITGRQGSATVINGKGGKTREVPLNNEIRQLLNKYLEKYKPSDELFMGQRGPLTTIAFNKIIEFYAKKAGIKCHPHTLRHTFAYNFLEQNKGDIVGLSQILGHSNLNTTAIYTQNRLEDLQAKVERVMC
jgi:integrase/recombinase XerC